MNEEAHMSAETLESGLNAVESSPKQVSSLDLIVRRPGVGLRELPTAVRLDEADGFTVFCAQGKSSRQSGRTPFPNPSATAI